MKSYHNLTAAPEINNIQLLCSTQFVFIAKTWCKRNSVHCFFLFSYSPFIKIFVPTSNFNEIEPLRSITCLILVVSSQQSKTTTNKMYIKKITRKNQNSFFY